MERRERIEKTILQQTKNLIGNVGDKNTPRQENEKCVMQNKDLAKKEDCGNHSLKTSSNEELK